MQGCRHFQTLFIFFFFSIKEVKKGANYAQPCTQRLECVTMTDEQIRKISWLNRVKRAENTALMYSNIFEKKKEIVRSMQKKYRIFPSVNQRNAIEAKIADMLEAERIMNKKFEEAEIITYEVHKAIHSVPDERLASLLNARYMLFQTQENTAVMLGNISIKTVERLHKKALDMLEIDGL